MEKEAIHPQNIPPQLVEHFAPDGTSLGMLNEYESTDLRVQIADYREEGYYMIFNGEKVEIKRDGRCGYWPSGLYDAIEISLSNLFYQQRRPR